MTARQLTQAEIAEAHIRRALDAQGFVRPHYLRHLSQVADKESRPLAVKGAKRGLSEEQERLADTYPTGVILSAISIAHNVPMAALCAPGGGRTLTNARAHALHACIVLRKMPRLELGRLLGIGEKAVRVGANRWIKIRGEHAHQVNVFNDIISKHLQAQSACGGNPV